MSCFFMTLTSTHTLLLQSSSLIFSLVNTQSVSNALRELQSDCAMCFWCVIARVNIVSNDPFFSLDKVVNILCVYWHFKDILFIIFHKHRQMILFFCHVWIRLINLHLLLLGKCDKSMHLPEFDPCPKKSTLRASRIGRDKI